MAQIDLLYGPREFESSSEYFRLMVLVLERMKIRMDGDKNQKQPHIHVDYGTERHAASYAIDTGERLAGNLRRKCDRELRNVIEKTRPQLLQLWNLTQSGMQTDATLFELRSSYDEAAASSSDARN